MKGACRGHHGLCDAQDGDCAREIYTYIMYQLQRMCVCVCVCNLAMLSVA